MKFSEHFTYRKILRHVLPSIVMMIFTSLYSVVDGLFLSNLAGKEAFAAVSFITPYLMMFNSTGFMFGTGGSALIAKKLGEKKDTEAREIFTTLVEISALVGAVLAAVGFCLLEPVARFQGAGDALLEGSRRYGRIYLLGVPLCIIQFEFEALYVTSGKGKLGLFATVLSGVMNIVLDALFLGAFSWGLEGAAIATVLSQYTGGLLPLLYYGRKNSSSLQLVRCRPRLRSMVQVCANGSSEMVNNLSISVVSLLFNMQLLRYAGDNGIAAYGILMYVNFLFTAVFWGYMVGISPVISFQYGAENHQELKSLLRKSLGLLTAASAVMFLSSEALAGPVSKIFAGYDPVLLEMTEHGFHVFSVMFLFAGVSIFGSSFFTALNNGPISALLSFSRVFLFQIPAILTLPLLWALDGIWIAIVLAELLTVVLSLALIVFYRRRYHY